ncbi:hypothetical protein [Phormidium sp. CCY1219]|jgi:hypothetical protein|uniref:hypothetical protein n=1 Tax=Phormidium sp. CCY1219 TaxID=2886104 RepID=UPI002D1F979E|nr:hypothetical protein [Phormidium sp. CCY1219]MEB3826870.1 PD-(D/E)XK nuclease family protein [Phormidium sp. CCY1219]
MTQNIANMNQFLEEFKALRASKKSAKYNQMADFLSAFAECDRALRQSKAAKVNIFEKLDITQNKSVQTRFLSCIFDADSNPQAPLFLEQVAHHCGVKMPRQVFKQSYRVQTNLADPKLQLDLAIYRPGGFLIGIDNTLLDREGIYQVDREFQELQRLGLGQRIPPKRQVGIFLTPDGRSPISGDPTPWHSLSYRQLADAFATLLPNIAESKLHHYLVDWIESVAHL